MRKSHRFKLFLLAVLLISAVCIFRGSKVYYNYIFAEEIEAKNIDNSIITGMAMQNSMETMLSDPVLSISDVFDETDIWNHIEPRDRVTLVLFGLMSIAAPLVEVLIIFSVLDDFLHLFADFTFCRKKVLVVGYNEHAKTLLKQKLKGIKIYLWPDVSLTEEEERILFLKKVSISDLSLGGDPDEYEGKLDKLNKFLKRHKITDVIILNDSDAKNVHYYMALSSCEICKEKTIHFYVLNDSSENRFALQDYFDSILPGQGKSKVDTHRDLRIFNFPQIQAEILFKKLPLYTGLENDKDKNVHLLVVGGGQVGEYVMLHAMNEGIFSDKNRILIDVIDKDVTSLSSRLTARFNTEYIKPSEDGLEFRIEPKDADGELRIRLTSADVYSESIKDTIRSLRDEENEGDFTYIAICLPDPDANLHCAIALKDCMQSKDPEKEHKIPVAFRMSHADQLTDFFKGFGYISDVYFMGSEEEYIGLEHIVNDEEERMVRTFNACYDAVVGFKIYNPSGEQKKEDAAKRREILWNKLQYYKRQSNRALYFHHQVKRAVVKGYEDEMELFWNSNPQADVNDPAMARSLMLLEVENGKLKFPNLLKLAKMEHRRFCYFYASEGWGFSETRNDKQRLHPCLVNWERLPNYGMDTLIYDIIAAPILMDEQLNNSN